MVDSFPFRVRTPVTSDPTRQATNDDTRIYKRLQRRRLQELLHLGQLESIYIIYERVLGKGTRNKRHITRALPLYPSSVPPLYLCTKCSFFLFFTSSISDEIMNKHEISWLQLLDQWLSFRDYNISLGKSFFQTILSTCYSSIYILHWLNYYYFVPILVYYFEFTTNTLLIYSD